ncbi:hypothetical protein BDV95DRAFT_608973 [Massariosphaeria phaeospora]|uniref:Chitin synthesis regulation, resistance to congo red-domain-containing protein n=1 Tax=Massariosphaeria phaeospora TaxID=100035 RepID=A0A7C8IC28_9PLEO|nr:hypothetical protein BDV95DRAFT_608973 [Massariosphaeria phaeospora]
MGLAKRYNCFEDFDGNEDCYREGFWYTEKGTIIKWVIFMVFVFVFLGWFVGGYLHAKKRLQQGKPLLAYHRWLISYRVRRQYGQTPQNHFTFYASQPPYGQPNGQPYGQRADGTHSEPPPMYNGNDAPPGYYAPPPAGAMKMEPHQNAMQMPQYGMAPAPTGTYPMAPQQSGVVGPQQNGVVGAGQSGDVEMQNHNQNQTPELPPRPQQAKLAITNFISKLRR